MGFSAGVVVETRDTMTDILHNIVFGDEAAVTRVLRLVEEHAGVESR